MSEKAYFSFNQFTGFNIIESRYMTIAGKTKTIKLTRKWKRRKIRKVTEILPNPDVMMMGNTIVGHPATIAKLRSQLGVVLK